VGLGNDWVVLAVKALAVALILALLFSSAAGTALIDFASANPDGLPAQLSMPVEYVNYTIISVNGTLWAKIDGTYPIHMLEKPECAFNGDLPMLYPVPPGTTNINVTFNDRSLSWSNYTQVDPQALHHTAIGDWWMISAIPSNVSDFFTLKIHYEHPLSAVNGSYLFLYDLNISPYLSPETDTSTAYFTVRMETNVTNLHVYTAESDTKWNPKDYTTAKEGSVEVISIQIQSEYSESLAGDLIMEFSEADQVPEFPAWTVPVLILVLSLIVLLYLKRRSVFPFALGKTTIQARLTGVPNFEFILVVYGME
jgi:hypothetical protein